jgi:NADH-quinone oxidoreductase subunit K
MIINKYLILNFIMFIIGFFGILINRKNVLIILMTLELILLSINMNFIVFSIYLDDLTGQLFALFVLTVAAAESATGLALLVSYYRVRGNISIEHDQILKG